MDIPTYIEFQEPYPICLLDYEFLGYFEDNVILAQHFQTYEKVVVKFATNMSMPDKLTPHKHNRLKQEAKIYSLMAGYENIPNLIHDLTTKICAVDCASWRRPLIHQGCIIMEYCAGESLRRRIEYCRVTGTKPGWPATIALFCQIAQAVLKIHQKGVVHHDIKPANIIIPPGQPVKILDFGISILYNKTKGVFSPGKLRGTLRYMSPERTRGQLGDVFSDVYSLGATFYTVLTGQPPFAGSDDRETIKRIRHDKPLDPCDLDPSIPQRLATLCLQMLSKNPNQRPDMQSVVQELEKLKAGE